MIKVDEIRICDRCLAVVDGDPGMGDAQWQAECAEAGEAMARDWPGFYIHSTGDEGGFSWSSCDGCGNPDGGTRYPAVVLAEQGTEN